MANDILDDLQGLREQATTERSHYYVASCAERAIAEIERLRKGPLTREKIANVLFTQFSRREFERRSRQVKVHDFYDDADAIIASSKD